MLNLKISKLRFCFSVVAFNLILAPLTAISSTLASNLFNENKTLSKLEYQEASRFTHLKWSADQSLINNIEILPILNFSGIPIEQRIEKANYYTHGKIPSEVNNLFINLIDSSHYFNSIKTSANTNTNHQSDYQFQLQINQYQLPFKYAPDDNWWTKIHDDVDRWLLPANNAKISLTLKITGNKMQTPSWSRTIESTVSACELNKLSQPMALQGNNKIITEYSLTTTGQAFISASNFLILQAIHHLNKNNNLAHVSNISNNEIFITSDKHEFSIGQNLNLFHNNEYSGQSVLPAGKVQIIKTYQNQAVAYPVNLRVDQIKEGDWVEASQVASFTPPESVFTSVKTCSYAEVIDITI